MKKLIAGVTAVALFAGAFFVFYFSEDDSSFDRICEDLSEDGFKEVISEDEGKDFIGEEAYALTKQYVKFVEEDTKDIYFIFDFGTYSVGQSAYKSLRSYAKRHSGYEKEQVSMWLDKDSVFGAVSFGSCVVISQGQEEQDIFSTLKSIKEKTLEYKLYHAVEKTDEKQKGEEK